MINETRGGTLQHRSRSWCLFFVSFPRRTSNRSRWTLSKEREGTIDRHPLLSTSKAFSSHIGPFLFCFDDTINDSIPSYRKLGTSRNSNIAFIMMFFAVTFLLWIPKVSRTKYIIHDCLCCTAFRKCRRTS